MPRDRRWLVLFVIVQVAAVIGAACSIGYAWDQSYPGPTLGHATPPSLFVHHYRGYPLPWDGWFEILHEDEPTGSPPPWSARIARGNIALPVLIMLLALTAPLAVARSLLRPSPRWSGGWVRVVAMASVVGLVFTTGDMLTGRSSGGFGFARSQVGRFCLRTETATNVVRYWEQRREFFLGDVTGMAPKYTLAERMLLTDAATRASLAFVVGLVGSALVYRPWRRPPGEQPASAPSGTVPPSAP